ncbi:predicted protein [Arabidopsis lyrata subsp. lyrata]|uniref:Predicted protein n=1 Tax=Arabidopsis lyrata subsp. lyrata TaxID=81972 RepID=D7M384_ARALL|nr:predicted protein [Arabidopsis lyrata subsp. lyrata]
MYMWKHRPTGSNKKIASLKSEKRRGVVILSLGILETNAQWADLTKDNPGRRTFKLPNTFYYKI